MFRFYRKESKNMLLCIGALTVAMLCGIFSTSARGGYDNQHDYNFLSMRMDDTIFSTKEISPIFFKEAVNKVSYFSLNAVLLSNRLLSVLSLLLFFAMLHSAGAGKYGSIAGSALLFLNFQHLAGVSSFCSTSINVFILIGAMSAILSVDVEKKIGTGQIAWIFSACCLAAMARVEHIPMLFILGMFVLVMAIIRKNSVFKSFKSMSLVVFGVSVLIFLFYFQLSEYKNLKLLHSCVPIDVLTEQLIGETIFPLFSFSPEKLLPFQTDNINKCFYVSCAFVIIFLLIKYAFGIKKWKITRFSGEAFSLMLCSLYFMCIYVHQDEYPLQFVRHRIYLLTPLCAMAAFAVENMISDLDTKLRNKRNCAYILAAFLSVYFLLNLKTVIALNSQLRTNDIELSLLASAQKDFQGKYNIYSDKLNIFMDRYFNNDFGNSHIRYISAIELSSREYLLGKDISDSCVPLKKWKFVHRFFTYEPEETRDPITIEPGFYLCVKAEDCIPQH